MLLDNSFPHDSPRSFGMPVTTPSRDHGIQAAADEEVLGLARQQRRTLISADTDGTLLARTGADAPSIILIRRASPRRAEQLAALLLANLDQLTEDLLTGAVVVVTDVDLRVRRLPIPPAGKSANPDRAP